MGNVLSSDDFDACLAIVVCRMGPNFYAHLSQVAGHYKGDASGIWDRSRGNGAPEGTAYEIKPLTRIHGVPEALIGPDLHPSVFSRQLNRSTGRPPFC